MISFLVETVGSFEPASAKSAAIGGVTRLAESVATKHNSKKNRGASSLNAPPFLRRVSKEFQVKVYARLK
jgi:hypothetical protein